jgi:hypothetical protein
VIELSLKRRTARCLPKYLQLLCRGGEGILLSQQGQGHTITLLEGEEQSGTGQWLSVLKHTELICSSPHVSTLVAIRQLRGLLCQSHQ